MPKEPKPKLIPCPACKGRMSGTAPACPKCGHVPSSEERASAAKSAKRGQVVGLIVGLALLVPVLSSVHQCDRAVESLSQSGLSASTPEKDPSSELRVVDWAWANGEYCRYIRGTVQNESYESFSYVEVEFNLYDDAGNLLDTAMTNVNNLDSHGRWKFEAIVTEDRATKARLVGVSGHL